MWSARDASSAHVTWCGMWVDCTCPHFSLIDAAGRLKWLVPWSSAGADVAGRSGSHCHWIWVSFLIPWWGLCPGYGRLSCGFCFILFSNACWCFWVIHYLVPYLGHVGEENPGNLLCFVPEVLRSLASSPSSLLLLWSSVQLLLWYLVVLREQLREKRMTPSCYPKKSIFSLCLYHIC